MIDGRRIKIGEPRRGEGGREVARRVGCHRAAVYKVREVRGCEELAAASVADPVTRAGAAACGAVVGIGETAGLQRQAAASDATGQSVLEPLQLGNPLV